MSRKERRIEKLFSERNRGRKSASNLIFKETMRIICFITKIDNTVQLNSRTETTRSINSRFLHESSLWVLGTVVVKHII